MTEDDIQKACVKMLTLLENQKMLRFFHVPNGGKRGAREGSKFKKMGVRPGVPDLVILPTKGDACFIELKAGKNTETDAQKEWGAWLSLHYRYAVCRSVDEMLGVLAAWNVKRGA